MFSTERNFVIVFLVVFFKIDQGIYCPENDNILKIISLDQFNKEVEEENYALLFFSSIKNSICESSRNVLKELVRENKTTQVKIYEVDIEKCPDIAKKYYVENSPYFMGLRNGEKYNSCYSAQTNRKNSVIYMIENLIRQNDQAKNVKKQTTIDTSVTKNDNILKIISLDQFNKEVQEANYAILFFSSKAKITCENTNGILNELIRENKTMLVKIYEIDIDKYSDIAEKYSVYDAPYLIGLRNGKRYIACLPVRSIYKNHVIYMIENLIKQNDQAKNVKKQTTIDTSVTTDDSSFNTKTDNSSSNMKTDNAFVKTTKDGNILEITSLDQFNKDVKDEKNAIFFFSSKNNASCEYTKNLLKELIRENKTMNVNIYEIDKDNSPDIAEIYNISVTPTLITVRNGKKYDSLLYDSSSRKNLVIKMIKRISEIDDQDDQSLSYILRLISPVQEYGTISQITSVADFQEKISQEDYSIIFFSSNSENRKNSCNRTKSILEELIREKLTEGVMIYELDIDSFQYYAENTWKVHSSPILISLRNGVQLELLESQYTDNKTKITKMINVLSGKYVEVVEKPRNFSYYYKIFKLEQLKVYATKDDYVILYFCLPSCDSCVKVSEIIMKLKEKPEYEKINIYVVDIFQVAGASDLFGVKKAPTLSAYRMDKNVDHLFPYEATKKNLIENMFKKLIENDKQANNASSKTKNLLKETSNNITSNWFIPYPKNEGILLKIISPLQYWNYVKKEQNAILYYSSQNKLCENTKTHFETLMENADNRKIKIFKVDIDNHERVTPEFNVIGTPTLVSLHSGDKIDSLGPTDSQNIGEIRIMFKTLLEYDEKATNVTENLNDLDIIEIEEDDSESSTTSEDDDIPNKVDFLYDITHSEQLENYVKKQEYVILYFTTPTCQPCKLTYPILIKYAKIYQDVKIFGVNIEKLSGIANYYFITAVPTLISVYKQKIIETLIKPNGIDERSIKNMFITLLNQKE